MKKYSILSISSSDTHSLRQKILRPNQPLSEMDFPHDNDKETFHLGLFIDERLSGIASVYKEDMPDNTESTENKENSSYRLRGMAIDDNLRGKGLGKLLLYKIILDLREKNAKLLWCNARTHAAGFYKASGFEIIGDSFDLKEIGPHYLMKLVL